MPHEVPADVAYRAAEERAVRTTRALILAEAQVATLERRVAELEREREQWADRDEGPEPAPCEHTGPDSPCDWNRCEQRGEVEHDGAEDGAGAGGAESEAGQSHPFHD